MSSEGKWFDIGEALKASKTILGFVGLVLFFLSFTTYGLIRIFANDDLLKPLIPLVLNFSGLTFFTIVSIILILLIFSPEKLMLGEVKAEVFLKLLRLRQGDSDSGEVVQNVVIEKMEKMPKKISEESEIDLEEYKEQSDDA